MPRDPAYRVMAEMWGPIETWRHCCFWCEAPILRWGGRSSIGGILHHDDGDHSNNDPRNIIPMHRGCHSAYHHEIEPEKFPTWRVTRAGADFVAVGRRLNDSLTHEQRVANGTKSWQTRGEEGRTRAGAVVRARWANPDYKERVAAAVKAGINHERAVAAAYKAWGTKRSRKAAS